MRIEPLGDRAFQIALAGAPDPEAWRRVAGAAAALARAAIPGVVESVPGFTTLTVHYDPAAVSAAALRGRLAALLADHGPGEGAIEDRLVEIPVVYGGPGGPDLERVAAHAGLTPDEVVRRHAAAEYRVHLLGFIPGFPYLAGLDPALATPRREVPRTRVPAGSVAIGGAQTGVYPLDSPGGWQLIGHTPLALFDPLRAPPALLRAGDRVRFVAVQPGARE